MEGPENETVPIEYQAICPKGVWQLRRIGGPASVQNSSSRIIFLVVTFTASIQYSVCIGTRDLVTQIKRTFSEWSAHPLFQDSTR
ncbi:hypothetical protein PoB_002726100 [Plakobranchus ocellatus]|uniref:DUF5641 domain-containing protein n=1 Tax=Plakobranchus ocellatus TaxID=259542 RepID=A0AAV3ZXV5_9GAST|nr:hypothetical protein PoB_002726100 [Plakobranchus ocellatus]